MKKKILSSVLNIFYIVVGIVAIVIAANTKEYNKGILGILVILSSVVHIVLYFIFEGYNKQGKSFYIVIGIIGLAIGIVFLCSKELTIFDICLYWGILDICRSSLEVKDSIFEIKNDKIAIVELVIALGDIVLGILLCIHGSGGIQLHLGYFGIAFLLSAAKNVIAEIIYFKRKNAISNIETNKSNKED